MSTRRKTAEGYLRAGAVTTRAGRIPYLRGELGLDGDPEETIEVDRTVQTLSHPVTLDTLKQAPITIGHPKGGVTPESWKDLAVGHIVGEPQLTGNVISADVLIGDIEAQKRLDEGIAELSIGYDFRLGTDGKTVGPLEINHIAIVERGRAGSAVRVLDSAPGTNGIVQTTISSDNEDTNLANLSEDDMSPKEMQDAFSAALDGFMAKNKDAAAMDAGEWRKAMGDALGDAMKPMMDAFGEMKEKQDAAAEEAAEAKRTQDAEAATLKAKDEAEKLVAATRAEERERFAIVTDAMPLIDEDKRAGLADADPKDILVAAVGDTVPDAGAMSLDYLRGAVQIMKRQMDAQSSGDLPPGVVPFKGTDQKLSSTDARENATKKFIETQADRYIKAGGR